MASAGLDMPQQTASTARAGYRYAKVAMEMKLNPVIANLLRIGLLVLVGALVTGCRPKVAHQRPYKWDQFRLPLMKFTQEPVSNVVETVNEAVRQASKGKVPNAVLLDTTPVAIRKFAPTPAIDRHMDEMIAAFGQHEQEMLRRGAHGYESAPFTGQMGGGHSLGCTFREGLIAETGLGYAEQPDAIHVWREPRVLECRAYTITKGLTELMEQQRQANKLHVDAEPIVSALATATATFSWSIMLPEGPNHWGGDFRFDKVFRHLPDLGLILALGTPEEHAQAEARLKSNGLWAEVTVIVKQ